MSQIFDRIKIYSDGADRAAMLENSKNPKIKGFTTNPSLMKKAGVKDYKAYCHEILQIIPDKPISFEVFADDFTEMERQGREIATWGKNVYVKIPVTNSKGESSQGLVKRLSHDGISLNVTALFTLKQVIETCNSLQGGAPSIASVFAGRIADSGRDPMPLMRAALEICTQADKKIELLWASTREVLNIIQAAECGTHIITAPPDILAKLSMLGKDLTQMSLETVETFKKDSLSAGFSL